MGNQPTLFKMSLHGHTFLIATKACFGDLSVKVFPSCLLFGSAYSKTAKFAVQLLSYTRKMESKKRKADLQLTAENYEEEPSTSVGDEASQQTTTHRY